MIIFSLVHVLYFGLQKTVFWGESMSTRIRERTLTAPAALVAIQKHYLRNMYATDWTFIGDGPVSGIGNSVGEYMEDVVTPGFPFVRAAGGVITSPLHHRLLTVTNPPIVSIDVRKTYNSFWNGSDHEIGAIWLGEYIPFAESGSSKPEFLGLGANSLTEMQRCSDIAVTSAHANIDESEMLALATMAEAGKTIDFLGNTLVKVTRLARRARKLEFRRIKESMSKSEFRDRYMELRYAVRPLIFDVNGIIKALKKPQGTRLRRTYRGKDSTSLFNSDVLLSRPYFHGLAAVDVKRSVRWEVSARAGVLCDVDISALTAFGHEKIAESAWELVPFSFIVDWFANVGKTIGAWTPNAGVNQRASWVVTRQTSIMTNEVSNCRSVMYDPPNVISNYVRSGVSSYGQTMKIVDRTPAPSLRIIPRLDINLSGYKLLDLGIILKGIFR